MSTKSQFYVVHHLHSCGRVVLLYQVYQALCIRPRLMLHLPRDQLQHALWQHTQVLVQWVQWVRPHCDNQREQAAIVGVSAVPREDRQLFFWAQFGSGPVEAWSGPGVFLPLECSVHPCLVELKVLLRLHVWGERRAMVSAED